MQRKTFLKLMAIAPLTLGMMKLNELYSNTRHLKRGKRMPVLFLGHGSPMNAIEENEFVKGWRNIAGSFEKPLAVLCVSAHWETKGTFVTAMEQPRTIHDFGGFPKELFEVQYPAPGSPELALQTQESVTSVEVGQNLDWGLDHGCWSVIKHMYPDADVPVIQLSLDYTKPPRFHFELAKELSALREKGILIVGSGNMVHNLRRIDWRNPTGGYDWAIEANEGFKQKIEREAFDDLIAYNNLGTAYSLSIPTPDHYLPLLYSLGLKHKNETISFFNDKTVMGSISMTSVRIG